MARGKDLSAASFASEAVQEFNALNRALQSARASLNA
jgi:hypothetical protein